MCAIFAVRCGESATRKSICIVLEELAGIRPQNECSGLVLHSDFAVARGEDETLAAEFEETKKVTHKSSRNEDDGVRCLLRTIFICFRLSEDGGSYLPSNKLPNLFIVISERKLRSVLFMSCLFFPCPNQLWTS